MVSKGNVNVFFQLIASNTVNVIVIVDGNVQPEV